MWVVFGGGWGGRGLEGTGRAVLAFFFSRHAGEITTI